MERETVSKCMQALEKVCVQLKSYLAQNETANADELALVKQVLLETFGKVDSEDEQVI